MVEPGRFSFKTWEDGLGNLCPPSSQNVAATEKEETAGSVAADVNDLILRVPPPRDNAQTTYLELHHGPIYGIDCPADGAYIVTGGFDGTVVIAYLDRRVRTVVGPMDRLDKFFCVSASKDGNTIVAGGMLGTEQSILKISLPDAVSERVALPRATGRMYDIRFCRGDSSIACLTGPMKETIGPREALQHFTSPAQVLLLDRVARQPAEGCQLALRS